MSLKSIYTDMVLYAIAVTASAANPSGTLPILFINTENNQSISSKENYINASYYMTVPADSEFEPAGTPESPLSTEIRGRGNWTWTGFDKKPYKLKLGKKASLLGMPKSKHWALLAHADDNAGFLRNTVGFELSRRLGLEWTPNQQPVEVILNGDYIGLYFLTENIRVEETRVNIVEQPDNTTENISGGWLVEIDNYELDPHITVKEHNTSPNSGNIIFTYKIPEILSPEQEAFLSSQMNAINDAIYTTDKNSTEWEKYVDIESLAKFYIVQEIMDDTESFHGSCYMYRDLGDDQKWKFGPVWDFGNAFRRNNAIKNQFIYQKPTFHQVWIGEIAKFPRFQEKVKELWADFAENSYPDLNDYIDSFAKEIDAAVVCDLERWKEYGQYNFEYRVSDFKKSIESSVKWLGSDDIWSHSVVDPDIKEIYLVGTFTGWQFLRDWQFSYNKEKDVYDLINVSIPQYAGGNRNQVKFATSDWQTVDLGCGKKGSSDFSLAMGSSLQLTPIGANINVSEDIEAADLRIDLNTLTLVTVPTGTLDITGVEDSVTSGKITVNCHTVSAKGAIRVYDAAGNMIYVGEDSVSVNSEGLFIIVTEASAIKIII